MTLLNVALLQNDPPREAWGDAFRQPGCYAPLVAADVCPPFIRPEARR